MCDNWKYFSQNAFNLPMQNVEIYAIKIWITNEDLLEKSKASVEYTCTDLVTVAFILRKIASGSSFVANCNGHVWRQFSCSGNAAICVDCTKDCTQCAGYNFIMQPCGNKDQCYTLTASLSVLSLSARVKATYPELSLPIKVVSARQFSLTINMNFTRPGDVYCLAYDGNLALQSAATIKAGGVKAVIQYSQKNIFIFLILHS